MEGSGADFRSLIQENEKFREIRATWRVQAARNRTTPGTSGWDRVDLDRLIVTIPNSKNGKTRHIPLNSTAVAAFKVLRQRSLASAGRVFVNMQGERLQGYKHWFEDAVSAAGIQDFTWYCLRHTFASRLVMAGVDLRTVAELMGHKTIQMTMRYAHLAPAHQRSAVERLVSFQGDSADAERQAKETDTAQEEPSATTTATSATESFSAISSVVN